MCVLTFPELLRLLSFPSFCLLRRKTSLFLTVGRMCGLTRTSDFCPSQHMRKKKKEATRQRKGESKRERQKKMLTAMSDAFCLKSFSRKKSETRQKFPGLPRRNERERERQRKERSRGKDQRRRAETPIPRTLGEFFFLSLSLSFRSLLPAKTPEVSAAIQASLLSDISVTLVPPLHLPTHPSTHTERGGWTGEVRASVSLQRVR